MNFGDINYTLHFVVYYYKLLWCGIGAYYYSL